MFKMAGISLAAMLEGGTRHRCAQWYLSGKQFKGPGVFLSSWWRPKWSLKEAIMGRKEVNIGTIVRLDTTNCVEIA